MDITEIQKLIRYIEENTRADKVSGIDFIDPRNFKPKVQGKQNYVVFGRRGAGKSTLLKTLSSENGNFSIYVNLEDYKDISFPNIIIKVLTRMFDDSVKGLNKEIGLFPFGRYLKKRKIVKQLKKASYDLKNKLNSPDSLEEQRKYKSKASEGGLAKSKVKNPIGSIKAKVKYSESDEKEVQHQWKIDKLNELKTSIDEHKELVSELSKLTQKQIILVLDDFYFIPKDIQAYLVDYFHRISKSNEFYLKIGTIKHRTTLYRQTLQSYVGMELNADVYDIDLDYTLDKWNELKRFKRELIDTYPCEQLRIEFIR